MKKILLLLMMMVSASFSQFAPTYILYNSIYYVRSYIEIEHKDYSSQLPASTYSNYYIPSSTNPNLTIYEIDSTENLGTFIESGTTYYFYMRRQVVYIPKTSIDCPNGTISNGECVNPTPTCVTGSHVDADLNVCVSDYEQLSKNTFDNGNFDVSWVDGAVTYCDVSTEKCITWDKDFNVIPNRYLNPELNPDGSINYGGIVPDAMETASWASVAYDAYGKPITNAIGQFLKAFGMTIALGGTGGGYLVSDTPGLNSLNPFATIGAGIFTLGSAMVTPDDVVTAVPTSDAVNVTISEGASASLSSLDVVSSATPSDGTPVFSPDKVYTYKQITDANLKTVWDSAAGVGTLPPSALVLGSDIIYPTNNPNTAIIYSSDKIEIVKTNADGSAQSVVVNKSDLANTANNKTDLPYQLNDYAKPVINNDGTVTQSVTKTPSTVSSNNTNTSTNPTTGQTTTTKATGTTANGSNGTNFDVSALTGRLDSLGNQLTKLNGTAETGNGLLSNIQNNTASSKNSLNGIESAINTIKNTNGFTAETVSHNIPDTPSSIDSWQTTYDNLKGDFDNVLTTVDELKSLVNGSPLTLNLSSSSVTTCPYSENVDFVYFTVPFDMDLCAVFSPFSSVLYLFTYFSLMIGIVFFAFKVLLFIGV